MTIQRSHLRQAEPPAKGKRTGIKVLVGSGDKIALFTLPFVIVAVVLAAAYPSLFGIEGSSPALRAIAIVLLIPGVTIWIWSVVLILKKVPRGELITNGPFALVKHPLYTSVALLVLPGIGFLFDSWLGAFIGIALYVGSRIFAPAEEEELSRTFGARWGVYCDAVLIPWL
jgi:protein-S-isoprenylcysteine O-methyltransferase Ste14